MEKPKARDELKALAHKNGTENANIFIAALMFESP
jgi:hypothetical protein